MHDGHAAELVLNGRFREALENLESKTSLNPTERAFRAWVELEMGEPEQAYARAQKLLTQTSDTRVKAIALLVSGKALTWSGPPAQGLPLLTKAVALIASEDQNLEATFLAQLVNSVFWIGLEPVLAQLPRLRQLALKTANRTALVEYHLAQARVAAFRNLHYVARREIGIAGDLLHEHPNVDQALRLCELQANVAVMDSNLAVAREYSERCLRMTRETGPRNRVAYALGNLAHIYAAGGDFEAARQLISECNQTLPKLNRARLTTFSTRIQIGMAAGDPEYSQLAVQEGLAYLNLIGTEQSYYRPSFEQQRVRWLLSIGNASEALAIARETLSIVPTLADKDLGERFKLLIAESLAFLGQADAATKMFGETCSSTKNTSLEVVSELLRMGAILTAITNDAYGPDYLRSAHSVLTSAGLVGLRPAIEDTARKLGVDLSERLQAQQVLPTLGVVGLLLRLGRHPAVLGREVLKLLKGTTSLEVFLVREQGARAEVLDSSVLHTATTRGDWDEASAIWLGREGETEYWLRGPRPNSASAALLLASISQIVYSALASQNLHLDYQPTVSLFELTPASQAGMVVSAERTIELLKTIGKLAPSNITVLFTGETGTGKELLARALHDASPRSSKPFIPFSCTAVSREMLDAQLFGYRRGSFTGATEAFPGVIRSAAGGTLFLDEIGEVALDLQPKLLRFLESGEIHPLGEGRPLQVDVRVVAATNADLETMVEDGRFREDLFYRLNVVRLDVPPLRERREEIPALVQHYMDKCAREFQKSGVRIADETMEYLILYRWPGNVRQLANEVRRMVALAEPGAVLMPEHLSQPIASSRRTVPTTERYLAPTEFVVRVDQPMAAAVEHVERSMIRYALRLTGGTLEEAAQRLGLSRKGLYLKRQRLGLAEAEGEVPPESTPPEEPPPASSPAAPASGASPRVTR